MTISDIPSGLWPHFPECDVRTLDLDRDANLIIQLTGWTKNATWCMICLGSVNTEWKETEVGSNRGFA